MVGMLPSLFAVTFSASLYFSCASSIPLSGKRYGSLGPAARGILERATPAAPHFFIYGDHYESAAAPAVSDIEGFTVFALSFLEYYGAADQAQVWEEMDSSDRSSLLAEYDDAGIALVVSLFGSTETPTTSGYDPVDTANTMAAWAIEYGLAGVDIDYEDFDSFDYDTGAEDWLITFTQTLRTTLPSGEYLLTHAPVAPWFSPGLWGGGGYLYVDQTVGDLIDWYNIQFYNQGDEEYVTCEGLLYESSTTWPESALFQISASGVDLAKLVIGKPATSADATNGYMSTSDLAPCITEAAAAGWNAGVSVWEYPDADGAWLSAVVGTTFTLGTGTGSGSGSGTTTTTTAASTTTTASSSSGQCAGVAAWSSTVAYEGGDEVTYDGDLWTAKWWSEADVPGGAAGDWTNDGSC